MRPPRCWHVRQIASSSPTTCCRNISPPRPSCGTGTTAKTWTTWRVRSGEREMPAAQRGESGTAPGRPPHAGSRPRRWPPPSARNWWTACSPSTRRWPPAAWWTRGRPGPAGDWPPRPARTAGQPCRPPAQPHRGWGAVGQAGRPTLHRGERGRGPRHSTALVEIAAAQARSGRGAGGTGSKDGPATR